MNILCVWVVPVAIACKGGVPEWRRNLTHELNLGDKPECNNEYGDEEVDEEDHHYDATVCIVLTYENSNTQI